MQINTLMHVHKGIDKCFIQKMAGSSLTKKITHN